MLVETDLGLLAERKPHVVRVGPDLNVGDRMDMTGRNLFRIPTGAGEVQFADPHLEPRDGFDIYSASFGQLASRVGARHVLVNPFWTPSDLDQIDPDRSIVDGARACPARCCLGPGSVSVLAATEEPNSLPGLLVTKPIDLTRLAGPCGEIGTLRVYWQAHLVERSEDRYDPPQLQVGRRFYLEGGDPEGFRCLVAQDGGGFQEVERLEPIPPCGPARSIRVAFRNLSRDRVYLVCYAILY